MNTLDARAQSAAGAIHRSVAEFSPTVTVGAVARRIVWHRALNYAGAVAVVALAVVVGTWLQAATEEADVADTLPPSPVTTTVVPSEEAPVVDPVEVPSTTVAPGPETGPQSQPPVVVVDPAEDGDVLADHEPEAEPEVQPDLKPPLIEITSPADGAHFEQKILAFEGVTEVGATVSAGPYAADVTGDGHWKIVLVLAPGPNGARFTATDAAGNSSTAHITVHYDPPPAEEPPPEKPPGVEFTANATFGSCSFDPPYDVYYGTAEPGTKITITSEFGAGSVTADAEGQWEVQVFFPDAPYEQVFLVSVRDGKDGLKKFEFVAFPPE